MSSTLADNLYELLGVAESADEDEIKKAYKRLARELHPDRFVSDEEAQKEAQERFSKVSHAFNVLKDPTQRSEYDFERKLALKKGLDDNIEVVDKPVEETGYKREVADRKYKMALQLQAEGDLRKAVELVKEAVETCPNVANYHALLAALYDRRGWHSYAKAEIEAALRLDPNDQLSQKLHKKLLGEIKQREQEEAEAEAAKEAKGKKKKGKKGKVEKKPPPALKGTQAFKKKKAGFLEGLLRIFRRGED
ncbi:MAG: DnaJ domain-containing protein [Candidatus Sericytochromatia bacterium]|nr:DnaJ domain-containing protein [Candidatus Tanganyikabacteria bacterium]